MSKSTDSGCVPYFSPEPTQTHRLPEELPTVAAKMVARKAKERIASEPWEVCGQFGVARVVVREV